MGEHNLMAIAILGLIIGASGLGLGAYTTMQYQTGALKGEAGKDGDDGTTGKDGIDGVNGTDAPGYFCSSEIEVGDALQAIGTGKGIITITANITLSQTINIDGGGSYVIQGQGAGTTIDCNGDRTAFSISNAKSCTIQNLKIDAADISTFARNIISIIEGNGNVVCINNIQIIGDSDKLGIGMRIYSEHVDVSDCVIKNLYGGIFISGGGNSTIKNNIINDMNYYGIYLSEVYSSGVIISGNHISGVESYGLYLSSSNYNMITGNIITNCLISGILLFSCDYNILSGNYISDISSNTASNIAGISIASDSDYNTINGNGCFRCTNPGSGTGYGIFIVSSTCNENTIKGNTYSNNDVNIYNAGTGTEIEYICTTQKEILDALTSIGAGDGIITIAADITLSQTINIDGGGSYVIQGQGAGTTIDCNGDRTAFSISNAKSCTIQNLKIDAADISTANKDLITIDELNENPVYIQNIQLIGDSDKLGIGMIIFSEHVDVSDCVIKNLYGGIYLGLGGGNNTIKNNIINDMNYYGISLYSGPKNNIISGNHISGVESYGLYLHSSHYNIITGNIITNCIYVGIYIVDGDYNILSGNYISDISFNTASNIAGIWITSDSDYNTINGNGCFRCTNPGSGIGYGIYIVTSDCDQNTIIGNTSLLNNVNWSNGGTNTFGDATNNNFS
ncbi:MAG: right-handed parallel beta-helix repeat-containing protein [Promethearchaeota archaeon]